MLILDDETIAEKTGLGKNSYILNDNRLIYLIMRKLNKKHGIDVKIVREMYKNKLFI